MSKSMRDQIATTLAPALQRWHKLEPRQQRLLGSLTGVVCVALVLAYVWLPAIRERERLIARLPQLRAQLALMQAQGEEIRNLTSTSLIAPAPKTAPDIAALQAIFGEGTRVSLEPNRALRVVIPKTTYTLWWDRIGELQMRFGLSVTSLSLTRLQTPGPNLEFSVDMLLADRSQASSSPVFGAVK